MEKTNKNKAMKIFLKSFVGILIALVCVSLFFIINYTQIIGKIIGFIFYILILMLAIFEFSSIFKLPSWAKYFLPLLSFFVFFNNWEDMFHWFLNDSKQVSLNVLISKEYQYIVFGVPGLGYLFNAIFCLIPFFFLKEFSKKIIWKYLLIFAITTIITISVKSILFMNVNSFWFLVMICTGTVITDTFAYFGGTLLGNKIFKRKLAPKISPNKTIEGAIVAFIVAWSILFIMIWFIDFNYMYVNKIVLLLVIPIFLPILAIFGDLLFSAIKRSVNIKDYSNLIPSHGGVLDRFDSLIITSIIFASFFIVV